MDRSHVRVQTVWRRCGPSMQHLLLLDLPLLCRHGEEDAGCKQPFCASVFYFGDGSRGVQVEDPKLFGATQEQISSFGQARLGCAALHCAIPVLIACAAGAGTALLPAAPAPPAHRVL